MWMCGGCRWLVFSQRVQKLFICEVSGSTDMESAVAAEGDDFADVADEVWEIGVCCGCFVKDEMLSSVSQSDGDSVRVLRRNVQSDIGAIEDGLIFRLPSVVLGYREKLVPLLRRCFQRSATALKAEYRHRTAPSAIRFGLGRWN
jgi:hypothetical protein